MKPFKRLLITGILTFTALVAFTASAKAVTVKVTGDVLNIRKSPSTSADIIARLSKGVECELIEEEGDWYKIKYQNYTGYISKQYAEKEETSEPEGNGNQTNNNGTGNSQTSENGNNEANNNQTAENNQATNNQVAEGNNNEEASNNAGNQQSTGNETPQIQYQKLTKDSSVRILPLIHSSVIGNLKKDVEVMLITKTGSWSYIQANEFNGWVRSDVLTDGTTVTPNGDSKPNDTTTTEPDKKIGYINESYVNVRKGAGTSYSIVEVLKLNRQITILGEEGDWYKVEFDGQEGYVSKQFVSDSKKTTSRSLENPRTTLQEEDEEEKTEEQQESESQASNKQEEKQETENSDESNQKVTSTSNSGTTNTNAEKSSETTQTEKETDTKGETNSSKGEEVVAYAKKFLGNRYVYGGDGSNGTFDCSGFTMYVYKHFGISLPHGATSQSKVSSGTKITSQSNLKAGDIVFLTEYSTGKGIGHCGIYVGNGNFIHASTTAYKVIISSLNTTYKGRFQSGMRFF